MVYSARASFASKPRRESVVASSETVLGLRSADSAKSHRHHHRWPAHQGGCAEEQRRFFLCLGSRDRKTDLAYRGAVRSAIHDRGEQTSPTQPFPTKPAAFDRQGVSEADLTDFTPELHTQALAALQKYNYGPLFTPESLQKPTIELPGIAGGASWSGSACDPQTGIRYVTSVTLPYLAELVPSSVPHTGYIGKMSPVPTMKGVPLWKPPYGRVTAIDLNTGDHRWMTPVGDLADEVPALKQLGLKNLAARHAGICC